MISDARPHATTTSADASTARDGRPRPAVPGRGRRRPLSRAQTHAAWLFLLPGLVVLSVFVVYPMGRALYLSFTDYSLLQPPQWVGLGNFTRLMCVIFAAEIGGRSTARDFALKPGAAALAAGFEAIPVEKIGLQRREQ